MVTFISIVWLICALLLIGIILLQKGRGGGLGGAFGGAGAGGGLLGTKTGDFLTWVTIGLVFLFFILAILLVKIGKPDYSDLKGGNTGTPNSAPLGDGGTGGTDTDGTDTGGTDIGGTDAGTGNTDDTVE